MLSKGFLHGASVSVLEFESPSRLMVLELEIPGFNGAEIQLPHSVRRVYIQVGRGAKQPTVVNFDRESLVGRFDLIRGWGCETHVGIFVRFSEQTLRNRREWANSTHPKFSASDYVHPYFDWRR
jgi:hypothetical protein